MNDAEITYAIHRNRYLPRQIGSTLAKMAALFAEAERRRLPLDPEWREQWDALRSRYLTDTKLIDREWEREIARARKQGENHDTSKD